MPRKMRVARAEEFWVEALVADSQRVKARVRAVEKLGGQVVIGLDVKDWVGARSGQFAMLQPVRSRCFLPRAFSVFTGARGGATGIVNFLIAPVGRGTEELAAMREGEEVWVLGPLGRHFPEPPDGRLVVVGGGTGVAPFGLLLESLAGQKGGGAVPGNGAGPNEILLLLGFAGEEQARSVKWIEPLTDAVRSSGVGVETVVMTEKGERGSQGLVTDALAERLESGDSVFACGPIAMCETTWTLAQNVSGVSTWFSLEASMACGTGSCQGCVLPSAKGTLLKVCRDGPVFQGERVFGGSSESTGKAASERGST